MPVLMRCRLRKPVVLPRRVRVLAQRILTAVGEAEAELSLEFVGDGRIRRLNRQYRHLDAPTDVLAFPMRDAAPSGPPLLGDVVISLSSATRQAAVHGHALEREVALLLIHGILHLCGYDHERGERDAKRMFRKQRGVLCALGPIPRLFQNRHA